MAERVRTHRYAYFLPGGVIDNIKQAGELSPVALVPSPGDLVAAVLVFHNGAGESLATLGGVDQTFELVVNGVATGDVFSAENGTLFFAGFLLPAPTEIGVSAGETLQLRTNGEAMNNVAADVNWVVRR